MTTTTNKLTKEQINSRIAEVARLLGGTYECQEEWAGGRLKLGELTLWAGHDSHKGKLEFSLVYPQNKKGEQEVPRKYAGEISPSIGVSDSKSAEKIAKDINNRLLDDAIKLNNILLERARQSDRYNDSMAEKRAKVRALLEIEESQYNKESNEFSRSSYEGSDFPFIKGVDVRINSDSFDLKIGGLSYEELVEILSQFRRVK